MYAELHAHSSFSFLDGASQPEELAARAVELGYEALAVSDHDGLYGSMEFAQAARALGLRPISGCELTLEGGAHVTLLVETRQGYSNLCRLVTRAHAHTRPPGKERELRPPSLPIADLIELNEGLVCLSGCARHGLGVRAPNRAVELARAFGKERFFVELQRPYERGDEHRNSSPARAGRRAGRRDRGDGRRPRPLAPAHHPPGRAGRHPREHVARGLRAAEARQPRERSSLAGADGGALRLGSRRRGPGGRAGRAASVRPDRGAGLPLSRLLG